MAKSRSQRKTHIRNQREIIAAEDERRRQRNAKARERRAAKKAEAKNG